MMFANREATVRAQSTESAEPPNMRLHADEQLRGADGAPPSPAGAAHVGRAS